MTLNLEGWYEALHSKSILPIIKWIKKIIDVCNAQTTTIIWLFEQTIIIKIQIHNYMEKNCCYQCGFCFMIKQVLSDFYYNLAWS